MPVFSIDQLTRVFDSLAEHFGMNAAEKSAWVEASLLAELYGNLMQSLAYFEHHNLLRITNGVTKLGATPRVIKELPGMAILDAGGALGPLVREPPWNSLARRQKQRVRSWSRCVTPRTGI